MAGAEELARGASIAHDGLEVPPPHSPAPNVSGFVPPAGVGACKRLVSS